MMARFWSCSDRGVVNDEAVLHIAFQHTLVDFIDACGLDQFDVRYDAMFGTEVEHFWVSGMPPIIEPAIELGLLLCPAG